MKLKYIFAFGILIMSPLLLLIKLIFLKPIQPDIGFLILSAIFAGYILVNFREIGNVHIGYKKRHYFRWLFEMYFISVFGVFSYHLIKRISETFSVSVSGFWVVIYAVWILLFLRVMYFTTKKFVNGD